MEVRVDPASSWDVRDWSLPVVKGILQDRLTLHLLFWVGYVTFFGLLYGSYVDNYYVAFMAELVELPFKMGLVYFSMYYLLPQYLLHKRYLELLVYLLLFMGAIAALMQFVLLPFLIHPFFCPDTCKNDGITLYQFIKNVINLSYLVSISAIIYLLKKWYKQQKAAQDLKQGKLEAELQFLKGQIHPHFLFNTLNSLYSLTLKKADTAPEAVLKLSELMDYMLYDAAAAKVELEKELKYIRNYIALERIRYGDRVEITYTETGSIAGLQIAPMMMLPFVENAFKHGVSTETDDAWVRIDVKVQEGKLFLLVENGKCEGSANYNERDMASGIGLKNVNRRLELLYEGQYKLEVEEEPESYAVCLKLELGG